MTAASPTRTETVESPTPSARSAVEATLHAYLAGARGEQGLLSGAFYSSCNLQSLGEEEKLEIVPRDRFIEFAEAGLLPEHESRIEDVQIVNDMARAIVSFEFKAHAFVDYLTLLRVRGRWTIVAKVYTKVRRP